MLDIFATYATDESLENNGAWFPIGPKPKPNTDEKQARLLIAREDNRAYNKAIMAAAERERIALETDDDGAVNTRILSEVMADTILLGWENLGFKGETKPYTRANAIEMLSVKDFRKLVGKLASDVDAYRVKLEEEQGKA